MDEDVMCYHNDSTHSGSDKMPNILIRNVSGKTLAALKAKARKNKRSLQSELSDILEREAKAQSESDFWELAAKIRAKQKYDGKSDVTKLIREDRDR